MITSQGDFWIVFPTLISLNLFHSAVQFCVNLKRSLGGTVFFGSVGRSLRCPAGPRSSARQGVEVLRAALQPVSVLQVGVVALGDPAGAVEEPPAAAGDCGGAAA